MTAGISKTDNIQFIYTELSLFAFFHLPAPGSLHIGHHKHLGAWCLEVEVIASISRKVPTVQTVESSARIFNSQIEGLLHLGIARISQNGTSAKGARSKFQTSLEPTNCITSQETIHGAVKRRVFEHFEACSKLESRN